ncbi:organic cation transporter protein-like isoform X3 [Leptopilina heterotoma]|uniref:organic cation transporter protein-like isoform X3 n=1 Tax=Leptopilina heterotoma TaxID=63436 RepID=UPI001CA9D1EA|nr:organic cation transporter protein-like isoform X3 [Leptopilina heterotoma]
MDRYFFLHQELMTNIIKLAIPESNQYPFYNRCHHKKLNFSKIIAEVGNDFNSKLWETNETVKCTEWEYDFSLISYPSIGVEMNWVCDEEYRIATSQAVFFIGTLIGNFLFSWISDYKGRLLALKVSTTFAFIALIGMAISHHFWSFTLSKFILGFSFDNILTIPLILAMEYTAENKRSIITCFGFGFTLMSGKLILTWSAYFLGNWRIFTILCSVPVLISFLLTFTMPESIRWYASKGYPDKVLKKLHRIARVNGKKSENWMYDELLMNLKRKNKKVESVNLWDLRKTPHLARSTFLFSFIFALTSVILDTNLYYLHRYELSIFVSFTWTCLDTLLAFLLFQLLVNRLGRRFIGASLLIFIAIVSFVFVFIESEIGKIFMASLVRIGMDCLACLFTQYVPELFPTPLRTQGAASIHSLASIIHFIIPYIIILRSVWKELPILIVAIVALFAAFLTLFLPETAGKNLRQTLEEGEKFCKEKKFWPILILQKSQK